MAYKGFFKPKNKEKYIGDASNIVYRSLKERSLMVFFDKSPHVISWGSEEIIVPYKYKVDNKIHRYFPDFIVTFKTKDNEQKRFLIEYKPFVQTQAPKKAKRETKKTKKRYISEQLTYIKNINKWDAAKKYADKNDMKFIILTEKDLKRMTFFKNENLNG